MNNPELTDQMNLLILSDKNTNALKEQVSLARRLYETLLNNCFSSLEQKNLQIKTLINIGIKPGQIFETENGTVERLEWNEIEKHWFKITHLDGSVSFI